MRHTSSPPLPHSPTPVAIGSATAAGRRPSVTHTFYAHFGHPRGVLGRIAGRVMAWENRAINDLVLDVLHVESGDAVLDVGCGPGVALAAAGRRAREGLVAGVDPSPVMVAQARRRNRRALSDGQVDVAVAPAERLPFADAAFSAALSVNSVGHWDDVPAGLTELHRVLAPGGRLVLALRAQSDPASMDPHAHGATPQRIDDLIALLTATGFAAIERRTHARKRELLVTLSARRA